MKDSLIHIWLHTGVYPRRFCPGNRGRNTFCRGFTLVEILIGMAIIATLAGIAVPMGSSYIDQARNARAIAEIRLMEKDIKTFEIENETLPNSLSDAGQGGLLDPWWNPYEYLKVEGAKIGWLRKDRFLVPVNSDYDLYSRGKDGTSVSPFTAKPSHDDIVRAADGGYVGLASGF